jgi:hypothetical protein
MLKESMLNGTINEIVTLIRDHAPYNEVPRFLVTMGMRKKPNTSIKILAVIM